MQPMAIATKFTMITKKLFFNKLYYKLLNLTSTTKLYYILAAADIQSSHHHFYDNKIMVQCIK